MQFIRIRLLGLKTWLTVARRTVVHSTTAANQQFLDRRSYRDVRPRAVVMACETRGSQLPHCLRWNQAKTAIIATPFLAPTSSERLKLILNSRGVVLRGFRWPIGRNYSIPLQKGPSGKPSNPPLLQTHWERPPKTSRGRI